MATYIDPRGKVLAHVYRLQAWTRGQRPAPVTIEWDLSNRCTLGCEGCHFAHTHTRGPLASRAKPGWFGSTGDLADRHVVLRALSQVATAGVRGVIWTGGGEPLTHPHWREIVVAAAEAGLEQGLYTHGALLQPWTELQRLAWAVVSLDAATADAYRAYKGVDRFDDACRAVTILRDAGVVTGASFLLSANTVLQAPSMLDLARRLGATYTTFRPLIETDPQDPSRLSGDQSWVTWHQHLLRQLAAEPDVTLDVTRFEQWRDWGTTGRGYATCYGIRLNVTITPDSRVWLCPNRRGMAEACLGDLTTEPFADLWERHPGQWTDFTACRAMCRLHAVNETAAAVLTPRPHEAFV